MQSVGTDCIRYPWKWGQRFTPGLEIEKNGFLKLNIFSSSPSLNCLCFNLLIQIICKLSLKKIDFSKVFSCVGRK